MLDAAFWNDKFALQYASEPKIRPCRSAESNADKEPAQTNWRFKI